MAKTIILLLALAGIAYGQTISSADVNKVVQACGYDRISDNLAKIVANSISKSTSDRNEAAMFLAQLIHESGGFRYKEEINGARQSYAPYFGRGFIQLTWDYNYRAASKDLFGDDRLIRDPGQVSRDDNLSMRVSVWFWEKNVRPAGGPRKNNFGLTTKAINGGIESSSSNPTAIKRYGYYKKAAATLGIKNVGSNQF